MKRRETWIAVGVWLVVLVALYLAAVVVHVTPKEVCAMRGGDWNEAWARCYGD